MFPKVINNLAITLNNSTVIVMRPEDNYRKSFQSDKQSKQFFQNDKDQSISLQVSILKRLRKQNVNSPDIGPLQLPSRQKLFGVVNSLGQEQKMVQQNRMGQENKLQNLTEGKKLEWKEKVSFIKTLFPLPQHLLLNNTLSQSVRSKLLKAHYNFWESAILQNPGPIMMRKKRERIDLTLNERTLKKNGTFTRKRVAQILARQTKSSKLRSPSTIGYVIKHFQKYIESKRSQKERRKQKKENKQ